MVSFQWPGMLNLLLLVPILIAVYVALQRRRQQAAARYGSFGLVQSAAGRQPGLRRHIPPALFLVSLIVLIVALSRPQTTVSLPRVEGTAMLVFDVSGSMAAEDFKPSRMEAAKAAALNFVEKQPEGVLIGVVAFSDNGFAVQIPTDDQAAVIATINRLAPRRGTSLAQGILTALKALEPEPGPEQGGESLTDPSVPTPAPTPFPPGEYASASIVLLTDGENNMNPDPFSAAQMAADRGVRIHTVGIGSPAGVDLEVEGFIVHTRLDEAALQQIAGMTGGTYFNAGNEEELRAIYEEIKPQFVIKPEETEVTSLVSGVSMLFLILGGVFSLVWFNRLP